MTRIQRQQACARTCVSETTAEESPYKNFSARVWNVQVYNGSYPSYYRTTDSYFVISQPPTHTGRLQSLFPPSVAHLRRSSGLVHTHTHVSSREPKHATPSPSLTVTEETTLLAEVCAGSTAESLLENQASSTGRNLG